VGLKLRVDGRARSSGDVVREGARGGDRRRWRWRRGWRPDLAIEGSKTKAWDAGGGGAESKEQRADGRGEACTTTGGARRPWGHFPHPPSL
jgi:hypothetical protein